MIGICTGTAPQALMNGASAADGARIFMPLTSAMARTGLSRVIRTAISFVHIARRSTA